MMLSWICFSISRILLETITLKELLRSSWSPPGFGLWHPFKVLRINCGSCVLNSVPNTSNFPLWVPRCYWISGSLYQKDTDWKQHWVSFFSQWEKSSIRNAKFHVGDYQARYLLQGVWISYNIYDNSATFFHSLLCSFIVIFIARRLWWRDWFCIEPWIQ